MAAFHLAQINIARMVAPLESDTMAGFVARLDEINAVADRSPGFVWRLQDGDDATSLRPFEDDRILVNMSVWESVEALRVYVYGSAHKEVLRQRQQWFSRFEGAFMALWWIPAGHVPTVDEAKRRLEHLEKHGPTPFAFTFKSVFPSQEAIMVNVALWVRLEAKAGKEADVEAFLKSGLGIVQGEPATIAWFAVKLGPRSFAIFDAFPDDAGRNAHLTGQVAAALMAKAPDLLSQPPSIEKVDVLAAKLP